MLEYNQFMYNIKNYLEFTNKILNFNKLIIYV